MKTRPLSSFLTSQLFCWILVFNIHGISLAQTDIPIGTWRLHLSYDSIVAIAFGDNAVYGAIEGALLVFDEDGSMTSFNAMNKLSATGISALAFNESRKQLLVGYSDGGLDIITDDAVVYFNRLKLSDEIIGSKQINHISVNENLAYLSTPFGVVVFDLVRLELRETWRGLSENGDPLGIIKSTFYNDSIFLATEKGVMAGDPDDNLLDFTKWKRFNDGIFNGAIASLTTFDGSLFAAISESGLYRYETNAWELQPFLNNEIFRDIDGMSSGLLVTTANEIWLVSSNGNATQIVSPSITSVTTARFDTHGNIWIGDRKNGLLSNRTGEFTSYRPNGPTVRNAFKIKYVTEGNEGAIIALAGGYSNTTGQPNRTAGVLNIFKQGQWNTMTMDARDITDIEMTPTAKFIASFGDGLTEQKTSGTTVYNDDNSSLHDVGGNGEGIYVSALQNSSDGLWVANYGASQPIHLLNNDEWTPFSFNFSLSRYPTELVVDFSGQLWIALDPARGGSLMVYNKRQEALNLFGEGIGSGNLPSTSIYSLALDHDGYVWVGTGKGVCYFYSATADAIKPIFENRFLLRDEKITAIEVDGGNRKWVGTTRGVWLFDPTGELLIHYFHVNNSPLPSNIINDIEINRQSGEVFIATDRGIVSYRSDATQDEFTSTAKIFPNPVSGDFSGMVGLSGLPNNAVVKITDISGKLIWETTANGNTATWNVRDYNGRRAATGVYLVFAAAPDGSESLVGKIAVVD